MLLSFATENNVACQMSKNLKATIRIRERESLYTINKGKSEISGAEESHDLSQPSGFEADVLEAVTLRRLWWAGLGFAPFFKIPTQRGCHT